MYVPATDCVHYDRGFRLVVWKLRSVRILLRQGMHRNAPRTNKYWLCTSACEFLHSPTAQMAFPDSLGGAIALIGSPSWRVWPHESRWYTTAITHELTTYGEAL